MKLAAKLVLIGAGIAGAVLYNARRRRDRKPQPQPRTPDLPPDPDRAGTDRRPSVEAVEAMIPPGISTVDPQPLTQISAEAIDPDATQAAHEAVAEQRDRLPVSGKNIL